MGDISIPIPESTVLALLGGLLTIAFGWVLRLERRSGRTAVRMDKHEEQCTHRQVELKEDLQEIKDHLQRQDERSDEHRERVNKTLTTIGVKVAVIQTRMKIAPTSDTGSYQKVDDE